MVSKRYASGYRIYDGLLKGEAETVTSLGIGRCLVSAGIRRQRLSTGYRMRGGCRKNGDAIALRLGIGKFADCVKN